MSVSAFSRGTGVLLVRRFLADYARNPVNLAVLVLVPAGFVAGAAGSMAQLARLVSGTTAPGSAVQTVTAGWAAGFIAATAAYFQVRAARAADRRLVQAGLPASGLAAARAVTGLALAVVASAAAVITLAARAGIGQPGRVVAATFMFAVIYLAIGALAGALVASPVNGIVLVFFVWITDAMFGPVFGSPTRLAGRAFPTHFLTMWMTGLPSHHAGRIGDLGWALAWTAGAAIVAWAVLTSVTRTARPSRRAREGSVGDQLAAAVRAGLTDWGRNRVLWLLLAALPAVFIVLATALAPGSRVRLTLPENGRHVTKIVDLAFGAGIHPAFMAPVAITSLAILTGMFIILDTRAADQRLVLAGQRPGPLLAGRLTLIAAAALLATAVSTAITATVASIEQWGAYIAASALLALTYALIGVILAPLFGRVAGVFVAFLMPFLDLGIAQDPMLQPTPPAWAHVLPGYGGFQMLTSAILTPGFTQTGPLLIALAWLTGTTMAAALLFRRNMRTAKGLCPGDILTQISATTRALQSVALGLLDEHLSHCVTQAVAEGGEGPTTGSSATGKPAPACSATEFGSSVCTGLTAGPSPGRALRTTTWGRYCCSRSSKGPTMGFAPGLTRYRLTRAKPRLARNGDRRPHSGLTSKSWHRRRTRAAGAAARDRDATAGLRGEPRLPGAGDDERSGHALTGVAGDGA